MTEMYNEAMLSLTYGLGTYILVIGADALLEILINIIRKRKKADNMVMLTK